ncbi:MAG: TetR/AcrR family transcriptional regulator [Actinomycetota bacterium]|nr:TetR/AcrR family transcriptional regulator [Actinomycetota bacterium]
MSGLEAGQRNGHRDDTRDRRQRVRMTGKERREQLLDVGRGLFAERGFEATSIEEIASRAGVSKPVVYEHFGGKEGLYAVVVDREMQALLDRVTGVLTAGHPKELLEQAALALLVYIEEQTDGFRILVRDSPVVSTGGNFSSLLNDIASQVEYVLAAEFKSRGFETKLAGLYSQALVGMVALTGQWWLEARKPRRDEVAAHLVNLAWNGLSHLEAKPRIAVTQKR